MSRSEAELEIGNSYVRTISRDKNAIYTLRVIYESWREKDVAIAREEEDRRIAAAFYVVSTTIIRDNSVARRKDAKTRPPALGICNSDARESEYAKDVAVVGTMRLPRWEL